MTQRSLSRNIDSIIGNEYPVAALYSQSLEVLKLQKDIANQLDPSLRDHIYLAGNYERTLIIYTDNPAWAAKLRYSTAKIINILTKHPRFKSIQTIRIKIDPSLNKNTATAKKLLISASTSRHLEDVAQNINDDALKFSLLKLAQNK